MCILSFFFLYSPSTSAPRGLVWRGVTNKGAVGLFDPTNVIPFIEPKVSPVVSAKTTSLARRGNYIVFFLIHFIAFTACKRNLNIASLPIFIQFCVIVVC